jgi:thiol-disulfide isomerase/thioredoxin
MMLCMKTDIPDPNNPSVAAPKRRVLLATAAVSAALAGAGLAWWRHTPNTSVQAIGADFWRLRLPTPSGAEFALADLKGKPFVLNFWATWCPPCIEELPLLDAFFKQNAPNGWQVLGIAVDKPAAVRDFLARYPISFPVVMAGLTGTDLSQSLGNTGGGLPFSVLVGRTGLIEQRKIGKISQLELNQWSELK